MNMSSLPIEIENDLLYAITRELRNEVCELVPLIQIGTSWELDTKEILSNPEKRMAIRSIFSLVEGACFGLKTAALKSVIPNVLTEADKLFAMELSYDLNDAGEIKERRAKLRTTSNIRFAFKLYAKAHQCDFVLDVSGSGWECITKGLLIRDRITHPKSLGDLTVNLEEFKSCVQGFVWFDAQLLSALRSSKNSLEAKLKQFRIDIEGKNKMLAEAGILDPKN